MLTKINKAFKFRIYPSDKQQAELKIFMQDALYVYNWGFETTELHYRLTKEHLNKNALSRQLTQYKKTSDGLFLNRTPAQSLFQVILDLGEAYDKYFSKLTKKPKLKEYKNTIRFRQRFAFVGRNKIKLPNIGLVKIKRHRDMNCKSSDIDHITVSVTPTNKWYVSVTCSLEIDIPEWDKNAKPLGIDLGITHLATLSTGEKIDNPKYLNQSKKKLIKLQRDLSRKEYGSANWEKTRLQVAKQHEKIANQRQDFQHKESTKLINKSRKIILESLNINGMIKNKKLARAISDASWGHFIKLIQYKARWNGVIVEQADRFFASSKTCSNCGYVNKDLKLSDRAWLCPKCEVEHDRDINAAINLSKQSTVGGTGI